MAKKEKPEVKDNDLQALKKLVEKEFGEGSVFILGEDSNCTVDKVPTGIFSLDKAIGGGIPRGRVVEIFGQTSGGKSSLCCKIAAEFQKQDLNVVYFDAENSLDQKLTDMHGFDITKALISQPGTAEECFTMAEYYAKTEKIGLIIIDSDAALSPQAEIDGEITESQMGLKSRLMSKFLRKVSGIINKTNTTIIVINQMRAAMGSFYGPSENATGGNAIKFYSSLRLEVKRKDHIKEGEKVVGQNVEVRVVKNKLAAPFMKAQFPLMFNLGFDIVGDFFETALVEGLIIQAGAWFSLKDGTKIGQGKKSAMKFLVDNVEIYDNIVNELTNEKEM